MWAPREFGASGAPCQQLVIKLLIVGFVYFCIGGTENIMVKILIVDDSNFSQKITSNLIKKFINDLEIYYANDGQEGFEKYKKINPDYMFVDLLMPNINRKELIKLVKEYDSTAKIIVISADVQKNVKEEIKSYNIVSFINKPINEEKAKFICDIIRNDKNE